jgi:hypothetical protein
LEGIGIGVASTDRPVNGNKVKMLGLSDDALDGAFAYAGFLGERAIGRIAPVRFEIAEERQPPQDNLIGGAQSGGRLHVSATRNAGACVLLLPDRIYACSWPASLRVSATGGHAVTLSPLGDCVGMPVPKIASNAVVAKMTGLRALATERAATGLYKLAIFRDRYEAQFLGSVGVRVGVVSIDRRQRPGQSTRPRRDRRAR